MSTQKLKKLKSAIENLDKIHHLKIFEVLKTYGIKFSENRNGIFVNMTSFDEPTIIALENALKYINVQEKSLKDVELIKKELEGDFFNKNNKQVKDNTINKLNEFQ